MKLPWVSRAAFDMLRLELNRADQREHAAEHRAVDAEARAHAADQRCAELIAESRKALADAASLSKTAAQALFAVPDGDVDNPPSVRVADRQAAIRMREERESRR